MIIYTNFSQWKSAMKAAKLLLFTGLFLTMLLLAACNTLNDVHENQYKDYQAITAAGEIQRGWAPEFLPESATNIHLKYNLDTNAVLLAFDFAPADAEAMTTTCRPVNLVPPPMLTADWWPKDLSGATFYECEEGYLALREGQGFFWLQGQTPPDAISDRFYALRPSR